MYLISIINQCFIRTSKVSNNNYSWLFTIAEKQTYTNIFLLIFCTIIATRRTTTPNCWCHFTCSSRRNMARHRCRRLPLTSTILPKKRPLCLIPSSDCTCCVCAPESVCIFLMMMSLRPIRGALSEVRGHHHAEGAQSCRRQAVCLVHHADQH